ncbi:MAG: nuclear transport factor 2 family protein, partial [Sediminibacterium sp.]
MKLTKKLEAEIKALMEDYWNSYFEGNLDHWAGYLVDNYRNIGGTEEEIWNSKKEIVDYTYRIIEQMQGATELRNKQTQIIPYDPYLMVHELLDIFIKVEEEWTFYQKFRLSSLIQKMPEGWKVLHQHGSYPDSKTQEGEAFAFDTLKNENQKLHTAIEKGTKELQLKNRELEIESALEKVRSAALAMKDLADMVDVCHIISDQLELLNVKNIRNVQTAIIYETKGVYFNYEYYTKHNKQFITEVDFKNHEVQTKFAQQMLSGAEELFTIFIKDKELKDWYAYQKTTNQFADTYLEDTEILCYYWYSLGPVALGISTYIPLTEEEINLFKRFRNVFSLAYQRYSDISLAETQAKEAQIEAALEKVRSRSMGMQKSDELKEVIKIVYQQLTHLKIKLDHAGFVVDYIPKGDWHFWIADEQDTPSKITHPYFESVWATQFNEAKETGADLFGTNLNFKEKNKFYKELLSYIPGLPEASKDFYLSCPGLAASTVLFDNVSLYIENFAGNPYSEEDNGILMRFGKVFQQTYTRFIDLQKAEAQAREAEIQLALERVRARSLAMHHTSELQEVVNIAAQQLHCIGMDINGGIFICINGEVSSELSIWASGGMADYVQKVVIPALDKPIFTHIRDAIKKGDSFLIEKFSDTEKLELFNHLFQFEPWQSLQQEKKEELLSRQGGLVRSVVISHCTSISITNHHGKVFTEEENEILKRFGKVFEQSYTRFLD